ncbi:hypothetical protein MHYP_G00355580 [Metynnis hypsauchen]
MLKVKRIWFRYGFGPYWKSFGFRMVRIQTGLVQMTSQEAEAEAGEVEQSKVKRLETQHKDRNTAQSLISRTAALGLPTSLSYNLVVRSSCCPRASSCAASSSSLTRVNAMRKRTSHFLTSPLKREKVP